MNKINPTKSKRREFPAKKFPIEQWLLLMIEQDGFMTY